jgi:transcriptional regulator with XRE-family HTH domain
MTKMVTGQAAKGVIAKFEYAGILRGVMEPIDSTVPPAILQEMRPERIGHRLKILRLTLGLTPSEISDRLNIKRVYWSRFENGKRAVSDIAAAALVHRYGVTLDWLILGDWSKLPHDLATSMRDMESRYSSSKEEPDSIAASADE